MMRVIAFVYNEEDQKRKEKKDGKDDAIRDNDNHSVLEQEDVNNSTLFRSKSCLLPCKRIAPISAKINTRGSDLSPIA